MTSQENSSPYFGQNIQRFRVRGLRRGATTDPDASTGSFARRHAWNPPTTSVARLMPIARSVAAASDEAYPSSQMTIQ